MNGSVPSSSPSGRPGVALDRGHLGVVIAGLLFVGDARGGEVSVASLGRHGMLVTVSCGENEPGVTVAV